MSYRICSSVLLLAAALLSSGCATTEPGTSAGTTSRFNDCFFARTLSDWRPLDDENLMKIAAINMRRISSYARRSDWIVIS